MTSNARSRLENVGPHGEPTSYVEAICVLGSKPHNYQSATKQITSATCPLRLTQIKSRTSHRTQTEGFAKKRAYKSPLPRAPPACCYLPLPCDEAFGSRLRPFGSASRPNISLGNLSNGGVIFQPVDLHIATSCCTTAKQKGDRFTKLAHWTPRNSFARLYNSKSLRKSWMHC